MAKLGATGLQPIALKFLKTFCKLKTVRPPQSAGIRLICKTLTQ
jgi:hypothetical protein